MRRSEGLWALGFTGVSCLREASYYVFRSLFTGLTAVVCLSGEGSMGLESGIGTFTREDIYTLASSACAIRCLSFQCSKQCQLYPVQDRFE